MAIFGPLFVNPKKTEKTVKTEETIAPELKNFDGTGLANSIYGSYGNTGGASLGAYQSNLADILASYDKQAATARQTAQSTYDTATRNANQEYETTRSDLLTSLKRFQEENAKNKENQMAAYNTSQAELESARAEADRQNRISNAARGLGGSGLQQLSQLQNLIGQGQSVSNLANANQTAMDKLKDALVKYEEDTNSSLNKAETKKSNALRDALTNYTNANNSIASTLATSYAQALANDASARNDWEYKRAQLAATNAARSASLQSSSAQEASLLMGILQSNETGFANELRKIKDGTYSAKDLKDKYNTKNVNTAIKKAYSDYQANINDSMASYGLTSTNNSAYDTAYSNLEAILKAYTDADRITKNGTLKKYVSSQTYTPYSSSPVFGFNNNSF